MPHSGSQPMKHRDHAILEKVRQSRSPECRNFGHRPHPLSEAACDVPLGISSKEKILHCGLAQRGTEEVMGKTFTSYNQMVDKRKTLGTVR